MKKLKSIQPIVAMCFTAVATLVFTASATEVDAPPQASFWPSRLDLPGYFDNIALIDQHGNGVLDLVQTARGDTTRLVFCGTGEEHMFDLDACETETGGTVLEYRDFNGDGISDRALEVPGALVIQLGLGAGAYTSTDSVAGGGWEYTTFSDTDRDGRVELAAIRTAGPGESRRAVAYRIENDGTVGEPILSESVSGQPNRASLLYSSSRSGFGLVASRWGGATVYWDGVRTRVFGQTTGHGGIQYNAVGDFDGNGTSDLMFTSGSDGGFVVFSEADGSMGTPVTLGFEGLDEASIYSSDLNGDGIDDAVLASIANPQPLAMTYLGDRSRRMQPLQILSSPQTYGVSLRFGDVNGDGYTDVVQANRNQLYVFAGGPDGRLMSAPRLEIPGAPVSFATGDVNGDSIVDRVIGLRDALEVHLGRGNGSYREPVRTEVSSRPYLLTLADFGGDGRAHVITNGLSRYVFDDHGHASLVQFETRSGMFGIKTADFNHDGELDFVVGGNYPDAARFGVYMNLGDGSFASPILVGHGSIAISLDVADMNGDGSMDIVGGVGRELWVYLGTGTGDFHAPILSDSPPTDENWDISSLAIADVNADGNLDVVSGGGTMTIRHGRGDGSMDEAIVHDQIAYSYFGSVIVHDLDGDDRSEIMWVGMDALFVYRQSDDGRFERDPWGHGISYNAARPTLVDFDLDGTLDIVIPEPTLNSLTILYPVHRSTPSPAPTSSSLSVHARNPSAGTSTVRYETNVRATVSLTVFDVAGRRVQRLISGSTIDPGVYQVDWDGRDESGRRVAPGVYYLRITNGKDAHTLAVSQLSTNP